MNSVESEKSLHHSFKVITKNTYTVKPLIVMPLLVLHELFTRFRWTRGLLYEVWLYRSRPHVTRLTVPAPLYEQLGVGLMGAG